MKVQVNTTLANSKQRIVPEKEANKRSMSDNALPVHALTATPAALAVADPSVTSHVLKPSPAHANHNASNTTHTGAATRPHIAFARYRPTAQAHKQQLYENKARSWAHTAPDQFQHYNNGFAWPEPETSRYVSRQLPDVRWVGARPLQRSHRSRSEPVIQWMQQHSAETFC